MNGLLQSINSHTPEYQTAMLTATGAPSTHTNAQRRGTNTYSNGATPAGSRLTYSLLLVRDGFQRNEFESPECSPLTCRQSGGNMPRGTPTNTTAIRTRISDLGRISVSQAVTIAEHNTHRPTHGDGRRTATRHAIGLRTATHRPVGAGQRHTHYRQEVR